MNELKIIVGWSEEDNAYLAKLFGISLAAHGDTKGEAMWELMFALSDLSVGEWNGILSLPETAEVGGLKTQ